MTEREQTPQIEEVQSDQPTADTLEPIDQQTNEQVTPAAIAGPVNEEVVRGEDFHGWQDPVAPFRRSERIRKQHTGLTSTAIESTSVPESYQDAVSSNEAHLWKQAINEEHSSLMKNGTWQLTELPPNRTTIKSRWIFK